jgi:hypothetical protein
MPTASQTCDAALAGLGLVDAAPGSGDAVGRVFGVVLTDNGGELSGDGALAGALGERGGEARPYYCDARRADQKGGCERNRPEIRKMLPKGPGGASLDAPGNADRALVMSEANSEPGGKLAWMAPMRAFAAAFGDDARAVLDALGMGAVGVDEPAPRGAARP